MRILIFSQYFTPEVGATSTRVHTFAAGLAARGHDVDVVCEVPNHPQGIVHGAYARRLVKRQRLDGFRGSWVWVWTKAEKTTRDRLAFYASYAAMATTWASMLPRPDAILASSPPLPVGLVGSLVAKRHRVPWVLDVRDLWPEAAVALGELANPRLLGLAERLEGFLYRDASAITVVTNPFRSHVAGRLSDASKVSVLPNGTTPFWLNSGAETPGRDSQDFPEDCFVWTFAGNVGLAQGLEHAIEAARELGPGYRLLILGDGAAKPALQAQARTLPDGLVEFRPQVPQPHAARLMRASDALLVSLAPHPSLEGFVPSKLFDSCATGRPVLIAAAGEAARLAADAQAGLAVEPGRPDLLAAALRRLRQDAGLRERLSANGRHFAEGNLREHQVNALENVLASVSRTKRQSTMTWSGLRGAPGALAYRLTTDR